MNAVPGLHLARASVNFAVSARELWNDNHEDGTLRPEYGSREADSAPVDVRVRFGGSMPMPSNHQRVHPSRIQRVRQERGAIIIFVALGLVVLIGMMGLAVDLGHAYVNKSQLQNIADACALAGASALNGTAGGHHGGPEPSHRFWGVISRISRSSTRRPFPFLPTP